MARQAGEAISRHLLLLRVSLSQATRALQRLTWLVGRIEFNHGSVTPEPRRKLRISPERRRTLKLQGQYMGYLRHLKPRQQSQVKAEKAKSGFPAAIKLARSLRPQGSR